MQAAVPRLPEALANTVDDRRALQRGAASSDKDCTSRTSRCPGGTDAEGLPDRAGPEGLQRRYGIADLDHPQNDARAARSCDRFHYELGVIEKTGFINYFLVVWDFVRFAQRAGHPGGARAAAPAAGSLVAYALGITGIDPLRYNLIFERFLNPERVSPPDFDIDFCQARRGEVIEYVQAEVRRATTSPRSSPSARSAPRR